MEWSALEMSDSVLYKATAGGQCLSLLPGAEPQGRVLNAGAGEGPSQSHPLAPSKM